jgi:hypothetical protein
MAWGLDELFQIFYAMDNFSALYNAFIDPLHAPPGLNHPEDPPGTDHGFGPLAGAQGGYCNRVSFARNLFAHCSGRQPMTQAQNYAHANNLHYNPGRPAIGQGSCVSFINNSGGSGFQTTPMLSNVVRNLVVRGPNNDNNLTMVNAVSAVPASSSCYLSGNAQHGWSAPANQAAFVTSAPVNFVTGTLNTAAWPTGWGATLDGTLNFAADPLAPTTSEKQNFTNLIAETVGVKPDYRPSYSRINTIRDQILAVIGGASPSPQMTDSVAAVGGWFDVPELTITDPTNPGAHWHTAPPLGSTRDDILLTGTFSNGRSKVGYSAIVAWAIEQHYFVGGS